MNPGAHTTIILALTSAEKLAAQGGLLLVALFVGLIALVTYLTSGSHAKRERAGGKTVPSERAALRSGLRVAGTYVVFGISWVLLSDYFIAAVFRDPRLLSLAHTYKSTAFVFVSGALVAWLVYRHLRLELHSEAALQQTEERFHLIIDAITDYAVYMLDARGRIVSWNTGARRIKGYEEKEILGWPLALFFPDEERAAGKPEALLRQAEAEGRVEHDGWSVRKDGRRFWANTVISSTRDAQGKLLGFVKVTRDVTEQRRAEQAVREAESKFRMLAEKSVVGIYIVQGGKFVYANPRLGEILGYEGTDLLNMAATDAVVPEDRALVAENLRRREAGEVEHLNYSFRALRRDGAAIHVEVFGGRTEYGGKTAIIGTLLDVTQQKQAEESLRQLPGLLLQSQDHERRRVARELHDSTAQILAALSLNLAALAEALPDAPVRVARLLAESQLLLEEASQQIRTRTYLLHPPLLEAAGLATAIRDYAIGFSKRSGIHVKLDLPEDWQRLDADEELALFRVVQEGLSNIHRHAKSPSARVRLTRDGQEIFLEIRDAGAGMTPEMLDRVRGLAGALGVGIAGMRERLHQLGGTLEIDSDGKGTRLHARMTVGKKHPHAR